MLNKYTQYTQNDTNTSPHTTTETLTHPSTPCCASTAANNAIGSGAGSGTFAVSSRLLLLLRTYALSAALSAAARRRFASRLRRAAAASSAAIVHTSLAAARCSLASRRSRVAWPWRWCSWNTRRMRLVRVSVFPLPAEATMRHGASSGLRTAACCSAVSRSK